MCACVSVCWCGCVCLPHGLCVCALVPVPDGACLSECAGAAVSDGRGPVGVAATVVCACGRVGCSKQQQQQPWQQLQGAHARLVCTCVFLSMLGVWVCRWVLVCTACHVQTGMA